jgi:hypothetical protein
MKEGVDGAIRVSKLSLQILRVCSFLHLAKITCLIVFETIETPQTVLLVIDK